MKARVVLDWDLAIGEVDRRISGGSVEHLGRHCYGGIHEPSHPLVDEDGSVVT